MNRRTLNMEWTTEELILKFSIGFFIGLLFWKIYEILSTTALLLKQKTEQAEKSEQKEDN
jgi:hypothetical protein